ncbi:MAG: glycosyltransferase, partial [Desulfobaccales bacterium]
DNLRRRFPSLARQRFYVVPGGLDLQAPPWAAPKPPATNLPLRILHIGRLVPVKTQQVLILALARLRNQGGDFQCRIVGDGPRRDELQKLILSLHLQDRVQLLGARYEGEVARLYDWSQVLVLSSRSEGTPMVIIEAMAKARPVIAPRLTAIPEMVAEGGTGYLFTSGDAADLADQLSRLLARPADLVRLGLEARRQAENHFDLRRNARNLMNVLARELPWVPGDCGVCAA